MQQAQHSTTRCPVFIHPAAASNPITVQGIQQATGQLVVISRGRPLLKPEPTLPAFENFGPWGGAA